MRPDPSPSNLFAVSSGQDRKTAKLSRDMFPSTRNLIVDSFIWTLSSIRHKLSISILQRTNTIRWDLSSKAHKLTHIRGQLTDSQDVYTQAHSFHSVMYINYKRKFVHCSLDWYYFRRFAQGYLGLIYGNGKAGNYLAPRADSLRRTHQSPWYMRSNY